MLLLFLFLALFSVPLYFTYHSNFGDVKRNSFYNLALNSLSMIIVPHQDDEISLAGALLRNLRIMGSRAMIVFTTNGDAYSSGEYRLKEAIKAEKVFGVPEENIIFLGYGNQWDTQYKHIYHAPPDEPVKSLIGRTFTYGLASHPDFRSSVSGNPSDYTRRNLVRDLKEVILKYKPGYIYAVDIDSHMDHRAASLLFEEAILEVLKENAEYRPSVFKGFSYCTAWNAKPDFYKLNMESTVFPGTLDNPNYAWNERIRFPVPPEALSYTLRSNIIYKALSKYKSQNATIPATSVINSDIVFWERKTTNLALSARIKASSGDPAYLNDFKLNDSTDISVKKAVFGNCSWIPDDEDTEKTVKICFDKPCDINCLIFHGNPNADGAILKGGIEFSDGTELSAGPLNRDGVQTEIRFRTKYNIEFIRFRILEYEGRNFGLSEIEIFGPPGESTVPPFIKMTVDDNFVYRYVCNQEEEITFNIYSSLRTDSSEYVFSLRKKYFSGKASLNNNILRFGNRLLPGKCIIRAELKNNKEIFDEVEVVSSILHKLTIQYLQRYEILLDRFVNRMKCYAKRIRPNNDFNEVMQYSHWEKFWRMHKASSNQ